MTLKEFNTSLEDLVHKTDSALTVLNEVDPKNMPVTNPMLAEEFLRNARKELRMVLVNIASAAECANMLTYLYVKEESEEQAQEAPTET